MLSSFHAMIILTFENFFHISYWFVEIFSYVAICLFFIHNINILYHLIPPPTHTQLPAPPFSVFLSFVFFFFLQVVSHVAQVDLKLDMEQRGWPWSPVFPCPLQVLELQACTVSPGICFFIFLRQSCCVTQVSSCCYSSSSSLPFFSSPPFRVPCSWGWLWTSRRWLRLLLFYCCEETPCSSKKKHLIGDCFQFQTFSPWPSWQKTWRQAWHEKFIS